jgi:excisionase family DNA binding protein
MANTSNQVPAPPPGGIPTLLSVEQVAAILGLHVRTIRGYVRRGALKATRIGKQYRIAVADLEAFTGRPVAGLDDRVLSPGGRVEVSSVIQVEGVTAQLASRMTNTLIATANVLRPLEQSLAVSVSHDVERDRLRVLVAADLATMRSFLSMVSAVLEPPAATAPAV